MGMFTFIAVFCIMILFYILPWLIARSRNTFNKNSIGVLTILLGWTGLVWVIMFCLAFTSLSPMQSTHTIIKRKVNNYEKD